MVIKPSSPVRRPMEDSGAQNLLDRMRSLPICFAGNHAKDQRPLHRRRPVRDPVSLLQQSLSLCEPGIGIVVNGAQRLTLTNRLSNFAVQHQPYRGINNILFLFPSATQYQTGYPDLLALNPGNESRGWTQKVCPMPSVRQPRRIMNNGSIAGLLHDDLAEFLERRAATDHLVCQLASLLYTGRASRKVKHP